MRCVKNYKVSDNGQWQSRFLILEFSKAQTTTSTASSWLYSGRIVKPLRGGGASGVDVPAAAGKYQVFHPQTHVI